MITIPSPRYWVSGLVYDDSDARQHTFNGRPLLSVTQALTEGGRIDYSRVPSASLAYAGLRGTAAHAAAHYYDEGDLDADTVDPAVRPYLEAWRLFRFKRQFIPTHLETVVFSRKYGFLGRLDRLGGVSQKALNGRRRVILADIKTGDPNAARADLQLIGYELALTEEFPELAGTWFDRWSVQLFPTGKYRVCQYPQAPRTWRHDRDDFLQALADARAALGLTWRTPAMVFDMNNYELIEPPDELEQILTEPPDEPHVEPEAAPAEPPAELVDDSSPLLQGTDEEITQALVERKNTIVLRASALARGVSSEATCQAAANYAVFINEALRAAHAHFDPLVARARAPYEDRLRERKEVIDPLVEAEALLKGPSGAVTRWLEEQKQAAAVRQRKAQEERDRQAAAERAEQERLRRDAEIAARAARAAGDTEALAEATRAAQEAELRRDNVVSEAVPTEAPPVVEGLQSKANWTFRCVDDQNREQPDGAYFMESVLAPRVLERLLAYVKGIDGWQTATGQELVAAIDFYAGEFPDVSLIAVSLNEPYLRTTAKANRDSLAWRGIKFYDAGQTAVNRRAARRGSAARA